MTTQRRIVFDDIEGNVKNVGSVCNEIMWTKYKRFDDYCTTIFPCYMLGEWCDTCEQLLPCVRHDGNFYEGSVSNVGTTTNRLTICRRDNVETKILIRRAKGRYSYANKQLKEENAKPQPVDAMVQGHINSLMWCCNVELKNIQSLKTIHTTKGLRYVEDWAG